MTQVNKFWLTSLLLVAQLIRGLAVMLNYARVMHKILSHALTTQTTNQNRTSGHSDLLKEDAHGKIEITTHCVFY
jgi:hypothetical protein